MLADIPGLIEGAAEGAGLGHQFLRHVERARVLVVLLDLASVDGPHAREQERVLLDELGRYRPELLERPRLVVGTKADVAHVRRCDDGDAIALGGDAPAASTCSSGGSASSSTRRAPTEPEPRAVRRAAPGEEGFAVVPRRRRRVAGDGPQPPSASSRWPTSPTSKRSRTSRTASAGWASSARWPGPAREGDLVRIGPVELEYVEGIC